MTDPEATATLPSNPATPSSSPGDLAPANDDNRQPEWTSQQLVTILRGGQALSAEDQQRLEAHLQRLRAQKALAQELAEFEELQPAKKRARNAKSSSPIVLIE